MQLKALTFDIIGTVFDAYNGLGQGVAPRSTRSMESVSTGPLSPAVRSRAIRQGLGRRFEWKILFRPTRSYRTRPAQTCRLRSSAKPTPRWMTSSTCGAGCRRGRMCRPGWRLCIRTTRSRVPSNMSVVTQGALRAHANLPFDRLLSAETVQRYKPNQAVYDMAIASLGVSASEILMVAAHNYDLNAAQAAGVANRIRQPPDGVGAGGLAGEWPRSELRLQRDQPDGSRRAAWRYIVTKQLAVVQ